jgi:hypothetical protein
LDSTTENDDIVVSFIVNDHAVDVSVNPSSDIDRLALDFCVNNAVVEDAHCPLHVYQELSHRLFCTSGANVGFKTWQFVHSPMHYDSDEFDLLRDALRHYGYKECWDSHVKNADTKLTWVLGHVMDTKDGYALIRKATTGEGRELNSFLGTEEWGNKDVMDKNLRVSSRKGEGGRVRGRP